MIRQEINKLLFGYITENWQSLLYKFLGAFGIFMAGWLAIKAAVRKVKLKVKSQSLTEDEYTKKMSDMLGSITFVSLMIFNILIIFSFLGLDVAIVMGALSIAIGFAMETTIKNMISGILLLMNKKNKLGDTVEVMGAFQLRGTIESVTLRHTVFRTIENRRVIIPNGALAETPIKTFKNEAMMRGELALKVPRHVNLDQVKQLVLQTVNSHEHVLNKEFTSVIVTGFDAHGVGLKSYYYLSPPMGKTEFVINSEIRTILSAVLQKYGVKAPYLQVMVDTE